MSNQSGISVSSELASEFPEFVESEDFAVILAIDHEKEHVALERRIRGGFEEVREFLGDGREARYIIVRQEDRPGLAFVQFMPDLAPLSSKMKYASSHATIHRQLGGSSTLPTSIFWTTLEEVSNQGIEAHHAHVEAPAPLTEEEKSLATATEYEQAHGTKGHSVAGQSTLAIHANVPEEGRRLVNNPPVDKSVVFRVSSGEDESIDVVETISTDSLASSLANIDEPRYALINLEGKNVFAFVCPRSATIKQRMLFASTRIAFLDFLKSRTEVSAVIETFDPESDLAIGSLAAELKTDVPDEQPQQSGRSKPKFQRPKPPRRQR